MQIEIKQEPFNTDSLIYEHDPITFSNNYMYQYGIEMIL